MPKDDPALTEQLVKGISDGCLQADCSLIGGETAILPDFYAPGDYDMAGFCVGVVERDHIIDGTHIQPGDVGPRPGRPPGCTPTATAWSARSSSITRG